MKKLFLATIFFSIVVSMYGQQEPQYTQYMLNPILINPAYAGSTEGTTFFGLYRAQWIGIEGAPKTANISMHKAIENSNLGYGVSVLNDRIGISDETQLSADLSYTLYFDNDYRLAFGLKASANLLNNNYNRLNQYIPGETVLSNNVINQFSPNLGAGLFYYNRNTYVGLSIPMLLDTKRYNEVATSELKQRQHIYLTAGKVYDLNYNLKFKPAIIAKMASGIPFQLDMTANFLYAEKFTFGVAYRMSAALSAMAGFQVSDNLFIGYGYDRETTRLSNFNTGSHEIFLQYNFLKQRKVETPRFF